jgi:NTP pyrophosphatase (non-canonical NTP hydrolase)
MANRLVEIMAALRSPGSGCARDLEQTFETIAPFTIEESYEIADAVARGDMNNLKEELGDLLLQVVFQARIAEERGLFDFGGGRGDYAVDAPASSACVRHCAWALSGRGQNTLGAHQTG